MDHEKRPFTTQEVNKWVDSMVRATRTEDPMKIAGRKDCIRDIRRAKKRHAQIIPVANAVYGEALKMGEDTAQPFTDPYYTPTAF